MKMLTLEDRKELERMWSENAAPVKVAAALVTMHSKAPKRWRCRSRKRLIKLMMSEGMGRNCAKRLADVVRGWKPYGKVWREYLWNKM